MKNKDQLLKLAQEVRESGVTTSSHSDLMKKASIIKVVSLLAAINK